MSAGLPPISWGMHEAGTGLIQLAPLHVTPTTEANYQPTEYFYKIFGGLAAASAEYELSCVEDWLQHPDAPEKTSVREYHGVYQEMMRDLDAIISSIDMYAKEGEQCENLAARFSVRTVQNYAEHHNQPTEYPSLRKRFQDYKMLLENIRADRELTSEEHRQREDFITMVRFFKCLEERYDYCRQAYFDSLHYDE